MQNLNNVYICPSPSAVRRARVYNGGHSDLKIVEIARFLNSGLFSELKLWFILIHDHIAKQSSVRFSVSIIFYKFRSSKCKQSVCLHYGLHTTLRYFRTTL